MAPWRGGGAINHDDDDDSDNDDDNNGDDNEDAFSKMLFCRIILVEALSVGVGKDKKVGSFRAFSFVRTYYKNI